MSLPALADTGDKIDVSPTGRDNLDLIPIYSTENDPVAKSVNAASHAC